jgi:hypothetical protein
MCRKLLSNPFFVKTRSVSLDFVAMLNVTRQRSFHILSPPPPHDSRDCLEAVCVERTLGHWLWMAEGRSFSCNFVSISILSLKLSL